MNNGKVRIYELSKELNLTNNEILAVCDQLNIAVKSHSSTISESEAERIRNYAEKYAASHSSPSSKPAITAGQKSKIPPTDSSGANQSLKKTPEILGIRKQPLDNVSGPQGTMTPKGDKTAKMLKAPIRANPVGSNEEISTQEMLEPIEVSAPSDPATPMPPKPLEAAPVTGKNELIGPPSRPNPPKSTTESENPTPPPEEAPRVELPVKSPKPSVEAPNRQSLGNNRPILKRSGAAATEEKEPARGPRTVSGDPEGIRTPGARRRSEERAEGVESPKRPFRPSAGDTPGGEAGSGKPRPVLPGQRPRPVRADASSVSAIAPAPVAVPPRRISTPAVGEEGDEPIETLSLEDLENLKRAIPPKPAKRKKRQDEEEEDETLLENQKAGKVAPKGKRRPLVLDDEDDFDEDDADGDGNTPELVSLSLVRPAKPKSSKPPAPRPTMMPVAKKPGAPGESIQKNRRDRRETAKQERPEKIEIIGGMTVRELALMLVVPETEIVRRLFMKGIAATVTQTLDIPTIEMVAEELGTSVETIEASSEARKVTEMIDEADLESLQRRPPVVTIMGHVDHGKTTLLDSIRKTKVAAGEAGGITQHIGAYHVDVEHNGVLEQIVFLDTPGHEAFTAMRARGARVTDIAILVVAADDGVRPQTIEAISHAKAANVPIVVAINKIDKEGAQPDRVKQELTEYGLVPEEWGGETIIVPVSAMTGENLDTLLEMLLLVSEVSELEANPNRRAKGTVIEAHLDKAKGPVATLLVQNGTLRVSNILVAGSAFGKVRAMVDDRGDRVEIASPSFAVEVLGLSDVPAAGDEFEVYEDEKEARAIAESRAQQQRESRLQQALTSRRVSLSGLSARAQEGELKELNIVLKADVQGSVEAIIAALRQLPQKEVQLRVLLAAPGEVTETDVDLAAASDAVILGFNTTLAPGSRSAADQAGVDVREYDIIYNLLDDVQGAMEGLLEPELVEEPLGSVEVRAVFPVGKGAVAGCYVLSGKAVRNCNIRVRRGNQIVYEGILDSLRRVKDDVKEVNAGFECGVGLDKFNDWQENDIIETYRMVTKRRTLSAN